MTESNNQALQAKLDLLHSLYTEGELSPEAYRARLAKLGMDAETIIGPSFTLAPDRVGLDAVGGDLVAGDQVGGDKVAGDKIAANGIGNGAAVAAGQGATAVAGSVNTMNIYHAHPPADQPLSLPEALKCYLDNLIDTYQHLRLQGIRAGGQPVSVDLEKVYISLSAVEKHRPATGRPHPTRREQRDEAAALDADAADASGGVLTIAAALARYRRLVIIGDPGSGKTTLLAYLALTYARDLRDRAGKVLARLQLDEPDCLPILLPLRDLARHLREEYPDPGRDGPALLLAYLHTCCTAQCIQLPGHFFERALAHNHAVVLLDGMDEVADLPTRQRVARLIEKFAVRYSGNRFVVTSREVGYEGPARIAADFGLAKVRDFNRDEVRRFVCDWTRVVEIKLAGRQSPDILRMADQQAEHLVRAIEANPRIAELAVNPLLLTVIALVHRYRAALPERRSELYEEAVEVLLARWDEAKGLPTEALLAGRPLDAGDRRILLEPIALWLHEQQRREIELSELRTLLLPPFKTIAGGVAAQAAKAIDAFVKLINERSGLLIERGLGLYSFAHLTFQGTPVKGISHSGAMLRPLRTRGLPNILPRGRKTKRDNSMMPQGKTRVPSNRSVSQGNLDMVKARLPESQGRAG